MGEVDKLDKLIKFNENCNSSFPNGYTRDWHSIDPRYIPYMLNELLLLVKEQQQTIVDFEKKIETLRFIVWRELSNENGE